MKKHTAKNMKNKEPKELQKLEKEKMRGLMISIFTIVFIDMLGFSIAIPILAPLFLRDNGILPLEYSFSARVFIYGLLVAMFPLAQFFGAPILGALSDKHGRKNMLFITISSTLMSYVMLAIGITYNNLIILFIGRILSGFMGGNMAIALSAIADISNKKAKAKNFGLVGMAFGFGFLIGPFIGGKLSDPSVISWFNYATPFWFAMILCLMNLILIIKVFPETLKTRAHTKISLLTGFRNIRKAFLMNNLRTMLIIIFFIGFGFSFYTQFVQVFLIEKFDFTQSQIGNFFGFMGFWIAFTQGVIMKYATRWFSPPKLLRISLPLTAAAFMLILFPSKAYLLFFIVPFIAIGQGITNPNATAIISNLGSKESQGEILGITQSIQSFAYFFPPLIAGVIASISITMPIIVASSCTITAWIIFLIFFKRRKEDLFKEVG